MPNQYIKNTTNTQCFNEINSEESAYWLGFLDADGSLRSKPGDYQLELSLKEEDYKHLVKFRNFIGNENKIAYREKQKAYRYCVRSKEIHSDLIRLGCIPKKTSKLVFPTKEQVPDNYLFPFLRGYFDGDGSLWFEGSTKGISILGTKEFLEGLQQRYPLLKNKALWLNHKNSPDGAWRIQFGGQNDMVRFLKDIYGNATIYLNRKLEKAQNFIIATL